MDAVTAQAALTPVTVQLWNSPSWSCEAPPCKADVPSLGAPHAIAHTQTVSADSLGGRDGELPSRLSLDARYFDTDFSSRWSGSFRAPVTGDCTFTLTVGGSAELYVDGARAAGRKIMPNNLLPCRLSNPYPGKYVSGCPSGGCTEFETLEAAFREAEARASPNYFSHSLSAQSPLHPVCRSA